MARKIKKAYNGIQSVKGFAEKNADPLAMVGQGLGMGITALTQSKVDPRYTSQLKDSEQQVGKTIGNLSGQALNLVAPGLGTALAPVLGAAGGAIQGAFQKKKLRKFKEQGRQDDAREAYNSTLSKEEVLQRSQYKGGGKIKGSKVIEIEGKVTPEIHTDSSFNLKSLGTTPHSQGGDKVVAEGGDIVFPTQNSPEKYGKIMKAIREKDLPTLKKEKAKLPKDTGKYAKGGVVGKPKDSESYEEYKQRLIKELETELGTSKDTEKVKKTIAKIKSGRYDLDATIAEYNNSSVAVSKNYSPASSKEVAAKSLNSKLSSLSTLTPQRGAVDSRKKEVKPSIFPTASASTKTASKSDIKESVDGARGAKSPALPTNNTSDTTRLPEPASNREVREDLVKGGKGRGTNGGKTARNIPRLVMDTEHPDYEGKAWSAKDDTEKAVYGALNKPATPKKAAKSSPLSAPGIALKAVDETLNAIDKVGRDWFRMSGDGYKSASEINEGPGLGRFKRDYGSTTSKPPTPTERLITPAEKSKGGTSSTTKPTVKGSSPKASAAKKVALSPDPLIKELKPKIGSNTEGADLSKIDDPTMLGEAARERYEAGIKSGKYKPSMTPEEFMSSNTPPDDDTPRKVGYKADMNSAMELAPIAYNLGKGLFGKVEKTERNYIKPELNSYTDLSDPLRTQSTQAYAADKGNARNLSGGSISNYRSNAQAASNRNMDRQVGINAQEIGRQDAINQSNVAIKNNAEQVNLQLKNQYNDIDTANRAAKEGMLQAGLVGLAQIGSRNIQNKQMVDAQQRELNSISSNTMYTPEYDENGVATGKFIFNESKIVAPVQTTRPLKQDGQIKQDKANRRTRR